MSGKGVPRVTQAQQERRRDAVVSLTLDGYAPDQIAKALGIAIGTVSQDRRARRAQLAAGPRLIKAVRRKHDPEPIDWMADPPPPEPPPAYVLTSPVLRIKGLTDHLRETNARNRFAFNITEAEEHGDENFLVGSQVEIARLIEILKDLQAIALRRDVQERSKLPDARDDLTMKDPHVQSNRVDLPAPGTGVLPGRIYQELWRYGYAKVPVDEVSIARIARRSGLRPGQEGFEERKARVRSAVAEMKEAGFL